jgi:hypothetical protein
MPAMKKCVRDGFQLAIASSQRLLRSRDAFLEQQGARQAHATYAELLPVSRQITESGACKAY